MSQAQVNAMIRQAVERAKKRKAHEGELMREHGKQKYEEALRQEAAYREMLLSEWKRQRQKK